MKIKSLRGIALTLGVLQLTACAEMESPTQVTPPAAARRPVAQPLESGDAGGTYYAERLSGDYRGYPAVERFIDGMVREQGFSREYLYGLLSQAQRKTWTIEYMNREKPTVRQKPGGWSRYRSKFLDERHIREGARFWAEHAATLARAQSEFGVSPEIIMGIIGVETLYGANFGTHRVIDALTTLAFDYPRRAAYFESELKDLLILSRKEMKDPSKPKGSFAGAMGFGQFMPSSFLKYAVDFNGDGATNLWDPEDAIGSIAHYFKSFGWQTGEPVVVRADASLALDESIKTGFDSHYSAADLRRLGVTPAQPLRGEDFSLLKLSAQEGEVYRIGYPNFYVITRYNHSTYYAMAVYELGQAVKARYQGR